MYDFDVKYLKLKRAQRTMDQTKKGRQRETKQRKSLFYRFQCLGIASTASTEHATKRGKANHNIRKVMQSN